MNQSCSLDMTENVRIITIMDNDDLNDGFSSHAAETCVYLRGEPFGVAIP